MSPKRNGLRAISCPPSYRAFYEQKGVVFQSLFIVLTSSQSLQRDGSSRARAGIVLPFCFHVARRQYLTYRLSIEEKGNIVKGCLATLTEFCDLHQESLEHSNHLFSIGSSHSSSISAFTGGIEQIRDDLCREHYSKIGRPRQILRIHSSYVYLYRNNHSLHQ